MKNGHALLAALCGLCSTGAACSDSPSGDENGAPRVAAGAPAMPGTAATAAPSVAGTTAPTAEPGAAASPGAGSGGSAMAAGGTTAGAGMEAPPVADAGMGMAGSDAADGGAQEMVSMPDLGSVGMGSAGVGVSDLEAATKFFVDLVGMKVQSEHRREDRIERVLTLGPAGKPTLTLMDFDDGRNTKDLPAKMVFYVQSPSAAVSKIRGGGYDVILSGAIGVGQVYGFDGYVLEFLSNSSGPLFISIAFAVTDLTKTVDFYTDAFGLMSTGSYYAGTLQEEFVQAPAGGAALVVQHYTSGNVNYKDNPIKSVWHVEDAAASLTKLVGLGATMVRPPSPLPAYDNRITAIAKDFDGYIIEVIE